MLEMRPNCENCDKPLPNESDEAMICTHECTFCQDCAENLLHNVCPNCGGGFEKRPTRPVDCLTRFCIGNFPASSLRKYRPVNWDKFEYIQKWFVNIDPRKR